MSKGGGGGSNIDAEAVVRAQAEANRVNQFTPFGNVVFSGPNRRDQSVVLDPSQQRQLGRTNEITEGLLGQAAGATQGGLDFRSLPSFVSNVEGGGLGGAQEARDAFTQSGLAFLTPQFEQRRDQFLQNFQNRGVPVGSENFDTGLQGLANAEDQALSSLNAQAFQFGGQEQNRLFGLGLQNAALQNQARGQGIQEQLLARQQPFNELAALSGGQQLQLPTFSGASPIDVTGANQLAQNSALAGQQQQNQLASSLLGAGGTIGAASLLKPAAASGGAGAIIPAIAGFSGSSRKIKEDFRDVDSDEILEAVNGLEVQRWRYNAGDDRNEHIGPMAEDWSEALDLPDVGGIWTVDAIGALVASVQALTARVKELEHAAV